MYLYLSNDLGLSEEFATTRSRSESERAIAGDVIRFLWDRNVEVRGKDVLDLGAGLGAMSEELVLQGARTSAIEPGSAWAAVAKRRAGRHGPYDLRQATGERLPFADGSFDVVVSLQVLEHVQSPREVLAEVYRVLRPGGAFYLACENYLAFREGHYKVFWLPLLPKSLGAAYLRLRGRSPKFLLEAVTYVNFPQVMRWTKRLGFHRAYADELLKKASALRGPVAYLARRSPKTIMLIDEGRRAFRFGIAELFFKPS